MIGFHEFKSIFKRQKNHNYHLFQRSELWFFCFKNYPLVGSDYGFLK